MKKQAVFLLFAVSLVLGMMGCAPSAQEKHRLSKLEKARLDSIDRAALKVAVMPTLDCLPIYLAYEDSLFKRVGVTVHLRRYMAQMDCDTALINKRVEASVTDLVRGAYIQRRGMELTYPIATNLYWQLITNRKARVSDIKQLSDKMIAMTRHSATDYLADLAIDSGKPKYDVYRVQINDLNVRLQMLLNNEMDAMLLPEPQATKARMEQHVVLMDSRDKDVMLGAVAFRSKVLAHPDRQAQKRLFIQAYNMAVDSINKNGMARYADLICKYCGVEEQVVKKLPKLRFQHAMAPRQKDLELARRWDKH